MYLSELTKRKPDWWSSDQHALTLDREAGSACTGIRVLKRLTRLTPVQRQLHAEKKVRVIPAFFAMKATVEAERKAGHPLWPQHQKEFAAAVAKVFGPGYALTTEAAELARARCELARAKVDAWIVLSPAAVAAKIARVPITEKERLERRVEEMLMTPPPRPPARRTFRQLFWSKVDGRLNAAMRRTNVPQKLRWAVRKAVHTAIETGAKEALGRTLDQLGVEGAAKQAVEGVVRAALQGSAQ